MTKLSALRLGSYEAAHVERGTLGQQHPEPVHGEVVAQPGVGGRVAGPDPDVGVAALVAGTGAADPAQRGGDHRPGGGGPDGSGRGPAGCRRRAAGAGGLRGGVSRGSVLCGSVLRGGGRDRHGGAVGEHHRVRHRRGRHERGPVDPVRAFRRGRGRGVEPRVPAEGQFHGRVGEAAANLTRVGVLDRDPQVRGGLLVRGRVGPVEAQQPHIRRRRTARGRPGCRTVPAPPRRPWPRCPARSAPASSCSGSHRGS